MPWDLPLSHFLQNRLDWWGIVGSREPMNIARLNGVQLLRWIGLLWVHLRWDLFVWSLLSILVALQSRSGNFLWSCLGMKLGLLRSNCKRWLGSILRLLLVLIQGWRCCKWAWYNIVVNLRLHWNHKVLVDLSTTDIVSRLVINWSWLAWCLFQSVWAAYLPVTSWPSPLLRGVNDLSIFGIICFIVFI